MKVRKWKTGSVQLQIMDDEGNYVREQNMEMGSWGK